MFGRGDKRGARVAKKIRDEAAFPRAGQNQPFYALQGFLGIAPVDIFLHAIEDLLNINPNIAWPEVVGLASLKILGHLAIDRFVIPAQDFGNLRVLHIEFRFSLCVIETLLPHRHPVVLRAISSLISHRNERAAGKGLELAHHQHEFGQRLKTVFLISA